MANAIHVIDQRKYHVILGARSVRMTNKFVQEVTKIKRMISSAGSSVCFTHKRSSVQIWHHSSPLPAFDWKILWKSPSHTYTPYSHSLLPLLSPTSYKVRGITKVSHSIDGYAIQEVLRAEPGDKSRDGYFEDKLNVCYPSKGKNRVTLRTG